MWRDWLTNIRLDWGNICNANLTWLQKVLDKHKTVFQDGLGLITNTTSKIHVYETAQPRFWRPRIVPYSLRGKVNAEIDRLAKSGIIELVKFSGLAAPIVPVVKTDGSIHICGDYKVTDTKQPNWTSILYHGLTTYLHLWKVENFSLSWIWHMHTNKYPKMKHPRNSPPSIPVRVSTSIHAFLLEYLQHQPYFKEWW